MKKNMIILLVVFSILSLTMIACAFGGSKNADNAEAAAPADQVAEEATMADVADEPAQDEAAIETEFPLLPDAEGVMEVQGTVIYQSKTSLADAFDFYQKEFTSQGLTENEILSLNEETMFQLVFTGDESGKSLVVQTLQLDDTTINVSLRYE